jgi:DNA-directed RNA polymerase subunit M/transcription elongation factor TFIIS
MTAEKIYDRFDDMTHFRCQSCGKKWKEYGEM